MGERIHDDEPDTTEATVRTLLARQCPTWADAPLAYLRASGTDHAMWRLHAPEGDDLVVRLPRRPGAAVKIDREVAVLRALAATSAAEVVPSPVVRHAGRPEDVFPHGWAVLGWLDGVDAWTVRDALDGRLDDLALDVAAAVRAIGRLADLPVDRRRPGERGGPLGPLLQRLERWLADPRWDAASLVDVAAVRRVAADARALADEPVAERVVHGDLIPGNLLLRGGRLAAVIDWSGAAHADPAQDLAPAWALFDGRSRRVFREAVGADEATWRRARAFELEHAVGGVLYYVPRRHPLGDLMTRTLHRILDDR